MESVPAIIGGLLVVGVVVALLRARGNVERFREYQAQQLALRRSTAKGLGLEAQGVDPARPLWEQAAAMFVDATEKVGAFPRFAVFSRVQVLFEGERNGFGTTVLVQRISQGDGPEVPDSVTTLACFVSSDYKLPVFSLRPAMRMPAVAEAALGVVAKVLKPLVRPEAPPEEEVEFDDDGFRAAYTVRASVGGLSEGLAARDIKEVFRPEVRGYFATQPGWSVEGLRDRVLVYRDDVEVRSERMAAFLEEAVGVAEGLRSGTESG